VKANAKTEKKRDLSAVLRNRIVGHGEEDPAKLKVNPDQWKRHDKDQGEPLEALLEKVGWVQSVIKNLTTGNLVDGHYRVELAKQRGEKKIPVVYVKLSLKEEKLVLALLDPLTGLAKIDEIHLEKLLRQLEPENVALEAMVAKMEADLGLGGNGAGELDGASAEVILDQAVQLEPGKEYIIVFRDDEEEFADLRSALDLQMVRRGGYKTGSPFDARGIERVVSARRLFAKLKKGKSK
jgi:ParB/Sulfiredoxin domain